MNLVFEFFNNLAIFFIVLSILVFIHEWGHFIFAKIFGVKVEEFGIGLPPKMKTLFKKGDTEYTLNWIPLGGFVRMLGQDDFDAHAASKVSDDPRSFENKSVFARICIVVGGVLMNFLFAFLVFLIAFLNGAYPFTIDNPDFAGKMYVENILSNTEAAKNDIRKNDVFYSLNGIVVEGPNHLRKLQKNIKNQVATFVFFRDGNMIVKNIKTDENGRIGVVLKSPHVDINFLQAVKFAFYECINLSVMTVEGVSDLISSIFTKQSLPSNVGGPIKIFEMTSVASDAGFIPLLNFMGVLSISLAMINMLPFPALDGGRFIFILVEGILRRRIVSQDIEGYIHMTGFILLIILMIAITWKDIMSLI